MTQLFGLEMEFCYPNHDTFNIRDDFFEKVRDCSLYYIDIDGSKVGMGFEIRTRKPFELNETNFDRIKNVLEYLKTKKAEVNKSCGIHIHVDVRNWKLSDIKKIVLKHRFLEEKLKVYELFNKRNNEWSQPLNDDYIKELKKAPDIDRVQQIGTKKYSVCCNQIATPYYGNTSRGSIEFRLFDATLDHNVVINYLIWVDYLVKSINSVKYNKKVLEKTKEFELASVV